MTFIQNATRPAPVSSEPGVRADPPDTLARPARNSIGGA